MTGKPSTEVSVTIQFILLTWYTIQIALLCLSVIYEGGELKLQI
jgi:hypothetical protein